MVNQVGNVNSSSIERFLFGHKRIQKGYGGPDLAKLLLSCLDPQSLSAFEQASRKFKIYTIETSYWKRLCKTTIPADYQAFVESIDERKNLNDYKKSMFFHKLFQ